MKKRLLPALLALVMVLGLLPLAVLAVPAAAGTYALTYDTYKFETDETEIKVPAEGTLPKITGLGTGTFALYTLADGTYTQVATIAEDGAMTAVENGSFAAFGAAGTVYCVCSVPTEGDPTAVLTLTAVDPDATDNEQSIKNLKVNSCMPSAATGTLTITGETTVDKCVVVGADETINLVVEESATLSSSYNPYTVRVATGGNLTITGAGTITNTTAGSTVVNCFTGGTLTVGELDGNGPTITRTDEDKTDTAGNSAVKGDDGSNITIHSGTFTNNDVASGKQQHSVQTFGTLTINGGTFNQKIDVWGDGVATITGGTFNETTETTGDVIHVGLRLGGNGKMIIQGGTFASNPNEAVKDDSKVSCVDAGYIATLTDGKYTVEKSETTAPVEVTGEADAATDMSTDETEANKVDNAITAAAGQTGEQKVAEIKTSAGNGVTIKKEAVANAVEKEVSVAVSTANGSVTLDQKALEVINSQAGTDAVSITVEEKADAATETVKAAYDVEVKVGDTVIESDAWQNLAETSIVVKVPAPADATADSKYDLYVDEETQPLATGVQVEKVDGTFYITANMPHLSTLKIAQAATWHVITVDAPANVTVSVTVGDTEVSGEDMKAKKGDTVVVTATADELVTVGEITLTDADGNPVSSDGNGSFYMPDSAVTVKITSSVTQLETSAVTYTPYEDLTPDEKKEYYGGKLVIGGLTAKKSYMIAFDNGNAIPEKQTVNGQSIPIIPRVVTVMTVEDDETSLTLGCMESMNVMVFQLPDDVDDITAGEKAYSLPLLRDESDPNKGVPVTTFQAQP